MYGLIGIVDRSPEFYLTPRPPLRIIGEGELTPLDNTS